MTNSHNRNRLFSGLLIAGVALIAAAGCGSSSSSGGSSTASKPAYCTDRSALTSSIQGLTVPTSSSEVSDLQTQFAKIKTNAATLVDSAKGDFPDETSAISSSVDTLDIALSSLPASPTPAQIVTVAGDASAVVTAVNDFSDATASQCG